MTSLKTYLAATAALLALGASAANATPYAYGEISFSNLNLSGLASGTINSATVTTSSGSNYDGLAADGASAGGDLTTGSNVRQSFSGPAGNAPPNDTYTPALLALSGSRGDSIISGAINNNASASDVAEGRLIVPSSTASSNGGTSTGINITFTATSPTTLSLSFTASDALTATTTAAGDGASSQVNASFSVTGGPTGFTPFIFSPDALNAAVSASGINGSQSFSSGPISYSTGPISLNAGTYQLSLLSGAQERLQTGAVAVPEPMSLALLGTGLIGMGAIRRFRRRA